MCLNNICILCFSFTRQFDLVCGRGWIKRALIVIQMAGLMVGCMTAGQMGDAIGRWWSNFIFVTVHCVGNLATAFSPGWEIFAACRFFIGVGIGALTLVRSGSIVLTYYGYLGYHHHCHNHHLFPLSLILFRLLLLFLLLQHKHDHHNPHSDHSHLHRHYYRCYH